MSDDFPTVTWQEYVEMLQTMIKTGESFTGYVIYSNGFKELKQINPPRCPDCEDARAKPNGTCRECGKQIVSPRATA